MNRQNLGVYKFALLLASVATWGAIPVSAKYDWLQFQFDQGKSGNNTLETTINASNVSQLKQLFKVTLADNPDGAPVLLTGVTTSSGVRDLIFVLGEHSNLTAFDANTGAQIWTRSFGSGGIINSSPAIDPSRLFIYVNTADGKAHKLNVGNGSDVTAGGWPFTTGSGKSSCQLTIATAQDGHNYLYCANQGHGRITTINLDTGTTHVFNLTASEQPDTESPSTSVSGCAPWSRGIPYDASLDRVFAMSGTNDGSTMVPGHVWRNSWVALPADGHTTITGGAGYPADSYTPTNWAALVSSDLDIGSGGLLILPIGLSSKYPHLGIQPGKDIGIRILNLADLSGKGGPGNLGGELSLYHFTAMENMRSEGCVWTNPQDGSVWAFVTGHGGIAGFKIAIDASGNPSLSLQWSDIPGGAHWTTSAFVANNVLYAATGGGEDTTTESPREVNAMNPTTGTVLWSGAIDEFHWASPILANGVLYMADGNSGGFGSGTGGNLYAWHLTNALPTVATPTFDPPAGTYGSAQSVSISTTTSGVTIRYTTDGSIPSETHGTVYGGSVMINNSVPLSAIAYEGGFNDSLVATGNYTITTSQQVAAPVFSPGGGTYTSAQNVTITSATSNATIHYTTDGSTPTETAGNVYSAPVSIGSTATLQAIAFESGFTDSPVTSEDYTINTTATTVSYEAETSGHTSTGATSSIVTDANASGGEWVALNSTAAGQYIEFNIGTAGGGPGPLLPAGTYSLSMRYRTNTTRGILQLAVDGTNLGSTLDQYATTQTYLTHTFGTVTFPTTDNHIIRLTVTGKNSASSNFILSADSFTFTPVSVQQQVAAPVFSPGGGTYTSAQNVTIASATSDASIRYTTDGSMPTETNGTIYSGPVIISSNTTLQAIAFESGLTDSTVTSATYAIGSVQTFNFEAASMSPVGTGATVSTSADTNVTGGLLEFLNSTAVGQFMTLTTPSMPAGTYQVQFRYKTNTTRAQHNVKIDGTQIGGTIDQYAKTSTYPTTTLGNVTFATTGTHTIVLTVTGKDSASTEYYITADKFTFVGQ
jgi:hypothetical protein